MDLGIYNKQNIIKRDKSEIEILLESLNKTKRRDKPQPVQQTTQFASAARSSDAVTFELSQQAKNEMLDSYIDDTLSKGEPLEGVTKEEFNYYHYRKTGNLYYGEELEREYRNAVEGYNNVAAARRWRYDPNYKIPLQICDSDEVIADREAAIEKYKTGAELEPWEKNVMFAFRNGDEYIGAIGNARHQREQNIIQSALSNALSDNGISLDPDETITFSVWNNDVSVSGSKDEAKNQKIEQLLSKIEINGKSNVFGARLSSYYYFEHKDELLEGGMPLSQLRQAEYFLQSEGDENDSLFDLSIDENGNIKGLPKRLDEFIKEKAVGGFNDPVESEDLQERNAVFRARTMRDAFISAINTINNGEYEKYRNMKCWLTYKNGILECV